MRRWLTRCRTLIQRSRHREDLDNEIRFHLEMETEKLIRTGVDVAEAKRRARLVFGGVDRFKEEVREVDGISRVEALVTDVRYALRRLVGQPFHTALLIGALGATVGSSIGIGLATLPIVSLDLPFHDPAGLVALRQRTPDGRYLPVSLPDLHVWGESDPGLAGVAGYDPALVSVRDDSGTRFRVGGAEVTANLFDVLGVSPLLGRAFTPEDDIPGAIAQAVVSNRFWVERLGADASRLGQDIEIGGEPHAVIGVMKPGFNFPSGADIWVSAGRLESYQDPLNFDLIGVARYAPQSSFEAIVAAAPAIGERLRTAYPGRDPGLSPAPTPFVQLVLPPATATVSWLLVGGVVILLLIGLSTCLHLAVLRHRARSYELATRLRLGATPDRVLRQLVTEGTVTAALALTIMFPIAWALYVPLLELARSEMPELTHAAPGIGMYVIMLPLSYALLLATLTTPTVMWWMGASGRRAVGTARGDGPTRSLFVGSQVAVAVALLSTALGATSIFLRLTATDPGFRNEGVVTALLSFPSDVFSERDARRAVVSSVLERIQALPNVEYAAVTLRTPVSGARIEYAVAGESQLDVSAPIVAVFNAASSDLYKALGIPLLAGRTFNGADDGSGEPVAIVSQRLADELWGSDPIGRTLRLGNDRNSVEPGAPDHRVVGVVGDITHEGYLGRPTPAVWVPYAQFPAYYATVVLRSASADVPGVIQALPDALRGASPEIVVDRVTPLTALLRDSVARPRLLARIMGTLAFTALLMTLMGTYAVLAWWVSRRQREVGIRRALGSTAGRTVAWVLGSVARPALLGGAFGAAVGWGAQRWLAGTITGAGVDPVWPVVALLLVLCGTGAAALGPALRLIREPIRRALGAG